MNHLSRKFVGVLLLASFLYYGVQAKTRYYDFKIDYANISAACYTKNAIVVNGQYPGPTIYATRGDRVIIKVTNLVASNTTIHWHGILQKQSVWSDGAALITQCSIQRGQTYVYNFTVEDQEGTLFWHAHTSWIRGTVHGAFIIYPEKHQLKKQRAYPKPYGEHILLLGEWWNQDLQQVEADAIRSGGPPALSNAYVVNGRPGPLYTNCSSPETEIVNVKKGKKYLLRVINNALETDLFITVANHSLTLVGVDASYTKHATNTTFLISPGQTYSFLLTADQNVGEYYIVFSPFERSSITGVQETPAAAILRYKGASLRSNPSYPQHVPSKNDSDLYTQSQSSIRSLNSKAHPTLVPQSVDVDLYYVITLNAEPCTVSNSSLCQGPIANSTSFASSINNQTFEFPSIPILNAYYYNVSGVYTPDFPPRPLNSYNYTGPALNPTTLASHYSTRATEIDFNSNVQLVLQGTNNLNTEAHPFHLHGADFYIVGTGHGNYNETIDPLSFNLVDPPQRNTATITRAGWTAIRWKADNPGAWLLHCHFDGHVTWGMSTVFIVKNGLHANETLPPPPTNRPTC